MLQPKKPAVVQVAEKFLERDELASMSFQNDFLTPFVVVMRQSGAKEIRELIIRQASRMVLSRVTNIKSGWKSMFMVWFASTRSCVRCASGWADI
jgi:brefeldin A-inhibited guanine nucleotide-exchange protein